MKADNELAMLGGEPVLPRDMKRARWPLISEEEAQQLARVIQNEPIFGTDSGQVQALEEEWHRYVGIPYCRAVSSGTAGLHMALWCAEAGPGTEVLVPAYSFTASAFAVVHAGAAPVFVDVDPTSYNMNPALIESRITPRTKAILVVHLAGLPADMDEITAIAQKHNLAVIEDAAHAHGATYKGQKTGSFGDAASFSINGVKNLVAGEAGLFTTRHKEYYDRAEGLWLRVTLAATRESEKYPLATLGYNYRCSVVAAAIARGQLKKLDRFNEVRRSNCERLSRQLRDIPGVVAPTVPGDRTHVYHMYRVRFDAAAAGLDVPSAEFRAKVVAALAAEGVLCRSWMNWTLPELPLFACPDDFESRYPWRRTWEPDQVYSPDECPEAQKMVEETAVVADAPTAVDHEVVDGIAAGFRKVFSRLDEVMRLKLSPDLRKGDLASCETIWREVEKLQVK